VDKEILLTHGGIIREYLGQVHAAEMREFVRAFLSRFRGGACDDYSNHVWTLYYLVIIRI
jgi:hypothetical protein